MTQTVKQQTLNGQNGENQTLVLESVNNGLSSQVESKDEYQEVKVFISRKGFIQMVNTILKNVGDTRRLSTKDSDNRIMNTLSSIQCKLNLSHLIDWDKCTNQNVLKSKETNISSDGNTNDEFLIFTKPTKQGKNRILNLLSCNLNKNLWSEVIRQYQDSEWLVDNYQTFEDFFDLHKVYTGFTILENENGITSIGQYTPDDLEYLTKFYPIHYGYVRDYCLFKEIELDDEYDGIDEIFSIEIPEVSPISYKKNAIESEDELSDEIKKKIKNFRINKIQWEGLLNYLKGEERDVVNRIDKFSQVYINGYVDDESEIELL